MLAPNGTAAIVCFPGIMYRGCAEQKIRKYLVDNNFVVCVIQLPDNLFFGTTIFTCTMVMKRNRILFIDASNQCVKVTNNNRLLPEHIDTIINAFTKRKDVKYFCRLVDFDEVKGQKYNLSVSSYVEQEDTREKIDIVKLNAEIREGFIYRNSISMPILQIGELVKNLSSDFRAAHHSMPSRILLPATLKRVRPVIALNLLHSGQTPITDLCSNLHSFPWNPIHHLQWSSQKHIMGQE